MKDGPVSSRRRPQMTVTGTSELVLEPQIRRFAARLYIGAAIAVALLALASLVAVRELAVIEPMLAAEGAHAARALVYELPVGAELHVPIEPQTDVLRFVIHAYGKSDLDLTPHPAKLVLDLHGARASRTEELRADLPGLRSRVTPENPTIGVGDPMSIDVDVHDIGVGELIVKLAEISRAEGLFVRAYRREQLSEAEATIREAALDRTKKNDLARWSWELGWDELTPAERVALLRARWKRIGALRGASKDLRSTTIAIAPRPPREPPPVREEMLGRLAVRGDERIAMLVHGGVKVRFVSDEATTLKATWRDAVGVEQGKTAGGQIELGPFDDVRSVEVSAMRDVSIEVRTSNADEVEWLGWTNVWRAGTGRPVVVESPEADRVVRVSLRKPMTRQDSRMAHLAASVELSGGGLPAPIFQAFSADRPRSRVDRYQDFDAPEAPSERAFFFLSLPRGSVAKISSADGTPLDVSLSELDETVPPLPMPVRAPDTAPPVIIAETEDTVSAFAPRRPSNAKAFEPLAHKVVRTARWFAPAPPPPPPNTIALAHFKHPDVDRIERGARSYDGITKPFELDGDTRRPLFVPIVAAFDAPMKVTVRVERDTATRGKPALFNRWTLPRTMEVGTKDMRATYVIGDDIPSGGKLRLRFTAPAPPARGAHQLVSLPWLSQRAVGPRWLVGAFEE
jgi:hypothetical protein